MHPRGAPRPALRPGTAPTPATPTPARARVASVCSSARRPRRADDRAHETANTRHQCKAVCGSLIQKTEKCPYDDVGRRQETLATMHPGLPAASRRVVTHPLDDRGHRLRALGGDELRARVQLEEGLG